MTARTLTVVDAQRSGSDLPTGHHLAKLPGARVIEDKDGARKLIVPDDTALGKLFRAHKITARQYEAGKLFAADWYLAAGPGVRAQSFEPPVNGGRGDYEPLSEIGARKRLGADHARVGPQLYACLIGVCGEGQSPSEWAKSSRQHNTIGAYIIGVALDLLAHGRGLPSD
jgi:hypothetical protein